MPWYVYRCKKCKNEISMVQASYDPTRPFKCNFLVGRGPCNGVVERTVPSPTQAYSLSEVNRMWVEGIVKKDVS